jgi:methyl-accepting chemotaxis protein
LGVFGAFVVATTIYMTTEMRGLTTGFMQDDKSAQAAAFYASEASQAASGMAADIGWLVVADDAAGKQTMEGRLSRNQALFDSALSNAAAALPARASEFEAVRQSGDTAYTTRACAQAVALGEEFPRPSGLIAANGGVFSGCEDSFMPPILALGKAVAESRMDAIHNETALTNKSGGTVFNPFALVLAGLVAVLVGGFFAVRAWVVTPIKGLQATMGKLTGGNLQASVAGVERRDEIGGMARAVHVFKDAGIEKLRLEAEAAAQRQAAEQERERTEAERAAAAKQQGRGAPSSRRRAWKRRRQHSIRSPRRCGAHPRWRTRRGTWSRLQKKMPSAPATWCARRWGRWTGSNPRPSRSPTSSV